MITPHVHYFFLPATDFRNRFFYDTAFSQYDTAWCRETNFSVTSLPPPYSFYSSSVLEINKFSLFAERKNDEDTEGENKYWDISATGNIEVGAATFELSVEKSGKAYTLKLSVDEFTLNDMLATFNFAGDPDALNREVFQTLGIKEFSVEWSFGDGPTRLE